MYNGKRIVRYAPDGSIEREVPFPVRCPTMVCFGGEHLDTMFVTSSRERRPAEELAEQPDAGKIFTMRLAGIRGVPEPKFNG
jgi:sugar lactone lactonase YvrE